MSKKILLSVLLVLSMVALIPAQGMCWYPPPPHHHHYHGHHGGDLLAWGITGLVVGSLVTAAALQPVPTSTVQYAAPPPVTTTQVYDYPPQVPSGMCRWERYVLDGQGNYVLGADGQPVREYTLGSCQYPPQ